MQTLVPKIKLTIDCGNNCCISIAAYCDNNCAGSIGLGCSECRPGFLSPPECCQCELGREEVNGVCSKLIITHG